MAIVLKFLYWVAVKPFEWLFVALVPEGIRDNVPAIFKWLALQIKCILSSYGWLTLDKSGNAGCVPLEQTVT